MITRFLYLEQKTAFLLHANSQNRALRHFYVIRTVTMFQKKTHTRSPNFVNKENCVMQLCKITDFGISLQFIVMATI